MTWKSGRTIIRSIRSSKILSHIKLKASKTIKRTKRKIRNPRSREGPPALWNQKRNSRWSVKNLPSYKNQILFFWYYFSGRSKGRNPFRASLFICRFDGYCGWLTVGPVNITFEVHFGEVSNSKLYSYRQHWYFLTWQNGIFIWF